MPNILTLDIQLQDNYQPASTFLATLEGNILEPIDASQISFYRRHIQVPFLYNIAKIKGIYYIYAILPDKEQNYSIKIKDVNYRDSQGIHEKDLTANFTVLGEKAEFSINPGFIITDKDFFISVQNNLDNSIEIKSIFLNQTKLKTISAASSEKINFEINDEKGLEYLTISSGATSYEIPIYLLGAIGEDPEEDYEINETIIEKKELIFIPAGIVATLNLDEELSFSADLFNPTQDDLVDIIFIYPKKFDSLITIIPQKIDIIEAGDSLEMNFTFLSEEQGEFAELILALSEDKEVGSFSTSFLVKENVTASSSIIEEPKYCSDVGGTICELGEKCSVPIKIFLDGACCPKEGKCEKQSEPKSKSKWLIFFILILAIIVVLYFILIQMKKKKFTKDILNSKTSKYEKRFRPKQETRESLET